MTPKRKQTNEDFFEQKQPVRFYKYVALTFLLVTLLLFFVVIFVSAKKATITITVRPDSVEAKQTFTIGSKDQVIVGKTEKTTVELQKDFSPQTGKEIESTAVGVVTLHNETTQDQALIPTTRLLTPEGILFRMKDRALVPANGTTTVEVYADKPGRENEIGPSKFTIPGLALDKQKVIYATSEKPMVGGIRKVGILGETDLTNAQKDLLSEMQKQGEEKLAKFYPNLTGVYKVLTSNIEADKKVGEEVNNFRLTGNLELVGFFYDQSEIKNLINKELEKKVVGNSEILSFNDSEPALNLDSYDTSSTVAVVTAGGSGLVTINPESSELAKQMFFGKSEDEVRRYLLSLDHVQGVEIKFSPAWVGTVPALSDHVNVVVKSVE